MRSGCGFDGTRSGIADARAPRSSRSHRSLRIGAEHLTGNLIARLDAKLKSRNPNNEVTRAWRCYQRVLAVYYAAPERGPELVTTALESFPKCPIPKISRHGRTLKSSWQEILNYFKTKGGSIGPTESVN